MNISLLQLLMDMGLFVLIWIVQLVIYPGFVYSSEKDVKTWHPIYTSRITIIVLPLMVNQLAIYSYLIFYKTSVIYGILLGLVLFCWGITFFISVPLHGKIDTFTDSLKERKKLVQTNWMRTIAWTLILTISIFTYGS